MPAVRSRPSNDERIRAALWFAEHGFGVFPIWSTTADGRCRCPKGAACDNPGKHPITAQGFLDATSDANRIRTFLAAGSDPNYGLVCPEGVFALDVDGDGIERLAALQRSLGPLPPTLRTITAHGEHVFLRWPDDHPRPIGQLWGYVTRWGSGQGAGYVIGPRSVHATGAEYRPGDVFEIATLPDEWAVDAVTAKTPSPTAIVVTGPGYVVPDRVGATESRYEAVRTYTAHLYNFGLSAAEQWALVRDVLATRFEQPLSESDLRARFDRVVNEKTAQRLGPPRAIPEPVRARTPEEIAASSIDAADLLALDLPPLRWIVPDLLPEGTTILAAPPKVGKSCFIYQVAVASAIGGELLGRQVMPGSVLYLALEDGKRRGQDRLRTALAGRTMPRGRLEVRWEAQRIGAGLEEDIEAWLGRHEDASLVAVDTLGKVRPRSTGKQGAYEVDVQDLARLQALFRDRTVALVIVHHARKEASDDFLASVSGTYGITGSADTIIVLRRKRLEQFGTVLTTGRDIADAEVPVQFADGLWVTAPAAVTEGSFERAEVYQVIQQSGPVFPKAIGDELGMERTSVQHMVATLVKAGAVLRTTGGYVAAGVRVNLPIALNTPHPSLHSDSEESEGGQVSRAPARTRGVDVGVDCLFYSDHQSEHFRDPDGLWRCRICSPMEEPA